MTLVEVVIALMLLLGGSLATAAVADSTARATASSGDTDRANGLAQDELELLRAAPYASLGFDPADPAFVTVEDGEQSVAVVGSAIPVSESRVISGRTFHIRRHITWVSVSDPAMGQVSRAYKRLAVDVEWHRDDRDHVVRAVGAVAEDAIAALCEHRGTAGDASLNAPINAYLPGVGTVVAGSTVISVGALRDEGGRGLSPGDLLLVMQMDGPAAGRYEYAVAASTVRAGRLAVWGRSPGNGLLNNYGPESFQIVVVPTFNHLELHSGFGASPWDGSTGGVAAVDAAGQAVVENLSLEGRGLNFAPPGPPEMSATSLRPGTGSVSGTGGGLLMLRAATVAGSGGLAEINADGDGDGSGGVVMVATERGELSDLAVNVSGPAGSGAVLTTSPTGSSRPDGAETRIAMSDLVGVGLGVGCFAAVTTEVESVTKSVPADGVTPADITITIRNLSAVPADAKVRLQALLPVGFRYASTLGISFAGGAGQSDATEPEPGSTTPAWGTFLLPTGSSVVLQFRTTVDVGTPSGTVPLAALGSVRSAGGFSLSVDDGTFGLEDDIEVTEP